VLGAGWYFQGTERIGPFAKLGITTKAFAAAFIFPFIHNSSDDWKVLALEAAGVLVSATVGKVIAYSETLFWFPSFC
jgi:hypothetical protein